MKCSLRIVFAGTPAFALPTLRALLAQHEIVAVYTQADKPAGRGQKLTVSPVKDYALRHQLPVKQPRSLKTPEAVAEFKALQPDLMVVIAYGMILPKEILEVPHLGCINVHASLLPRWRGAAPLARAMLAGDALTGVSIMQMDEGLDTGGVYLQMPYAMNQCLGVKQLHDDLAELGAVALIHTLNLLMTGCLSLSKQNSAHATYAKKISREDGTIDWQQDAVQIARQVRALTPWPGAVTKIGEQIIKVCAAHVIERSTTAVPGTIMAKTKTEIHVACGRHVLAMTVLQLPNRKALPVKDVLNAFDNLFEVGMQFLKNSF